MFRVRKILQLTVYRWHQVAEIRFVLLPLSTFKLQLHEVIVLPTTRSLNGRTLGCTQMQQMKETSSMFLVH